MSEAPAGPRRKRGRPPIENLVEKRRAQIIASAVTVFAEHGYEATSMSDIARHAGLGQGTVYRYVSGKREMLDLVFDYSVEELMGATQPMLLAEQPITCPDDLLNRFDAALSALVEVFDNRPALRALIQAQVGAIDEELKLRALGVEQAVAQMASTLFEQARDARCLRPGADPEVLGLLVTKLVLPVGLREIFGGADPEARSRYRAAVGDFMRHAFFAEAATR
jgi:AcrR family transcriptional regulator